MDYHETPRTPYKAIFFIVLSGALVVLVELFVLGGNTIEFEVPEWAKKVPVAENGLLASELKEQHLAYMEEGIYLGPDIYPEGIKPPPDRLASVDAISILPDDGLLKSPAPIASEIIGFSAPPEDEEALASIAPALGADDVIEGEVFEEREIISSEEKDVDDILSDLGVEPVAEEEVVEEIEEEIEIAKADPVIEVEAGEAVSEQIYVEPTGTGMVAVIIDDMGLGLRSRQLEVMPGPLTLSYLPYAKNLNERAQRATAHGHEVMLHMPMEPLNGKLDGGPDVLLTTQSEEEFLKTLDWGLSSFEGFVGLNNHMGSRLTRDKVSMQRLMTHLKGKGLYFVDSKTIGSSVAAETARNVGIPYAVRDIFLDHEISEAFVKTALKKLERTAYRQGYAIAIGHPHKETISALKDWLPTLADKGLTLVPASRLVKQPQAANDNVVQVAP